MKIMIKNGTIVTAADEFRADLLIEDEKIAAIGSSLEIQTDEVVDAEGLYVLPGGVDQHTHFNFTFKTATVRGFETSNAALAGGTTTIVDFANQEMGKSLKESIDKYNEIKVAPKVMCDYSFHGVSMALFSMPTTHCLRRYPSFRKLESPRSNCLWPTKVCPITAMMPPYLRHYRPPKTPA
jgi:dihydropyrimidinase